MATKLQPVRNKEISALRNVLIDWSEALRRNDESDTDPDSRRLFEAAIRAKTLNPWFTTENTIRALDGLAHMLREEAVSKWLDNYPKLDSSDRSAKRIGLVAAGNVPMVGFHDVLTTIVAGHKPVVKLSTQDAVLLPTLFEVLADRYSPEIFPVTWVDGKLSDFDAVIATGSNNTARYFEYYFGKYPHVIRKNRNSVAVISGDETDEELHVLGDDFFAYFGLGCRNVAKIYIPADFKIDRIFEAIYPYNQIVNHHKYANNYDYYKATWLLNDEKLLDNGFVLFRESTALGSPVGSVYFERYDDAEVLRSYLDEHSEMIQCVVSRQDIPFGQSQKPELWDYADGVDTMEFLLGLK